MTPEEVKGFGYPSNTRDLIEACEGVTCIEENEAFYLIHDTYNDNDRVLQINKNPSERVPFFEFFQNEIDREKILSFAKNLPDLLFMNLKKVYFVEKDEDLEGEVDEESPNHTFFFDDSRRPIGMAIYRDSVIFINLRELKKLAKEEVAEDLRILGYSNGEEQTLLDAICQTLAHELFHLMQFNPLIEEIIPEGEEPAEEFCRAYAR